MKTLILSGFGTNCEKETVYACRRSGAEEVTVSHINTLYGEGVNLADFHFIILIGGFLDGDDLGSARACSNRFRYRPLPGGGTFLEELAGFIEKGGLVLGICNGFQLLVKLGLLPGNNGEKPRQTITLAPNERGRFEDRWVHLAVDPDSPSLFTRGISRLELPIRHGEGRIIGEDKRGEANLVEQNLAPLRYCNSQGDPSAEYPANPNGSAHGIAALCNSKGTVLGLMPHPEAFNHYTNHPQWKRRKYSGEDGAGLALFKNAYSYLKQIDK